VQHGRECDYNMKGNRHIRRAGTHILKEDTEEAAVTATNS